MHDATLAEAKKRAWLDGTDIPAPPSPTCADSQVRHALDDFAGDWELDETYYAWGEYDDDPICDCGQPGYACRCWEREQATIDKLWRDTWEHDERRVGALRHLELGPAPCPACDGDGVYEARIRGRFVPIGLCARCRGVARG